ncbi:MAG: hypothetical protein Kow0080_05240 [Candidatus Promineifilaceae bacterium]
MSDMDKNRLSSQRFSHLVFAVVLPLLTLGLFWQVLPGRQAAADTAVTYPTAYPDQFGYGFNVASLDFVKVQSIGFNWIKLFSAPGYRLPVNVLLRVDANSSHLNNLSAFANDMTNLATSQKGYVDAYEIGNEPNLDASYGWTTAPVAADYAALLCTAYNSIKAVDPDAIVISAGLAPTGRVSGNWNGHAGHNGLYQDDREFLKEFLAAGGGNCLDAVGYHNYGFSADYDTPPDTNGGTGPTNCSNGFCFRGVEVIHDIMLNYGLTDKQVWTTEFGWIVEPPSHCLQDASWSGRLWQIVSEQKQADNLVGAFQYARANYPWVGGMIVFNLNFNLAGYAECEQMRFYGVQGRPADAALTAMPKDYSVLLPRRLSVLPLAWTRLVTPDDLPVSAALPITLKNAGSEAFDWGVTAVSGTNLTVTVEAAYTAGTLGAGGETAVPVTITSAIAGTGPYSATVTITATHPTTGAPVDIPFQVLVVDTIYQTFLPAIFHN